MGLTHATAPNMFGNIQAVNTTPAEKIVTRYNKKAVVTGHELYCTGKMYASVKEAAQMLGVSESTVRRWMKASVVKTEMCRKEWDGRYLRGESFRHMQSFKSPKMYRCLDCSDLENLLDGKASKCKGIIR